MVDFAKESPRCGVFVYSGLVVAPSEFLCHGWNGMQVAVVVFASVIEVRGPGSHRAGL